MLIHGKMQILLFYGEFLLLSKGVRKNHLNFACRCSVLRKRMMKTHSTARWIIQIWQNIPKSLLPISVKQGSRVVEHSHAAMRIRRNMQGEHAWTRDVSGEPPRAAEGRWGRDSRNQRRLGQSHFGD